MEHLEAPKILPKPAKLYRVIFFVWIALLPGCLGTDGEPSTGEAVFTLDGTPGALALLEADSVAAVVTSGGEEPSVFSLEPLGNSWTATVPGIPADRELQVVFRVYDWRKKLVYSDTVLPAPGSAQAQGVLAAVDSARLAGDGATVSSLQITDEMAGWRERENGLYRFHDQPTLAAIINGGADLYIHSGMVEGLRHKMIKGDSTAGERFFEAFVMDFGTPGAAEQMFIIITSDYTDSLVTGAYPLSVAMGRRVLGGVAAYAHFRNIYLEITLSGYAVEPEAAAGAAQFLKVYQQKVYGP